MRISVMTVAIACGACASSIGNIREHGDRSDYQSRTSPQETAQCVKASVESFRPYIADVFTPRAGTIEVSVRHPNSQGIHAVFEIAPHEAGNARITAWRARRGAFYEFPDRVAQTCGAERVGSPVKPAARPPGRPI